MQAFLQESGSKYDFSMQKGAFSYRKMKLCAYESKVERASVAQTTDAAPESSRIRAHSERVDPVVTTSSMSNMRFPAIRSALTAR